MAAMGPHPILSQISVKTPVAANGNFPDAACDRFHSSFTVQLENSLTLVVFVITH